MELPQKLKYLRKQMGLSQLELAEKLHISRQAVSGWESGTSKPSTESLKSLGALYDVPLEYLLHKDSSELDHVEPKTEKKPDLGHNIRKRIIVSVVITALLFAGMFIILRYIAITRDDTKITPIEEMENVQWEISGTEEFGVDW